MSDDALVKIDADKVLIGGEWPRFFNILSLKYVPWAGDVAINKESVLINGSLDLRGELTLTFNSGWEVALTKLLRDFDDRLYALEKNARLSAKHSLPR